MAILRAGDMGSIRAWLPSRRSVDSQRGACVMVRSGHVGSGRSIGVKARYRSKGIPLGCCWLRKGASGWDMIWVLAGLGGSGGDTELRSEGSGLANLAAAPKEQLDQR